MPLLSQGQDCSNATYAQPQTQFDFYEVNGEAYAFFIPTLPRITIGLTWAAGMPIPNQWNLYSGKCNGFIPVQSGMLAMPEDFIFYFQFDSLNIGKPYYFKLSGVPGSRFELQGYLTENLQPSGTCISSNCNLVQNPGFEQAESIYNQQNPVGGVITANPLAAFADQACGWDLPVGGGNTPDYVLGPGNNGYGVANPPLWNNPLLPPVCTTGVAVGNGCPNSGHTGSQGYTQIFSLDNRPGQNRREYVITTLNQDVENGGIYYIGLVARPNMNRQTRSSALQALIVDDNTISNNPLTNNQPITQWGTPQANFSNQIDNTNGSWQTVGTILQYNNPDGDNLVIGNFLDNAATQPFLDVNQPPANTADNIPSLWVDDVEVIHLPDAGIDQVVCDVSQVQPLGNFYCLNYPSNVQTNWYNSSNQLLSSSLPFTPTITQPGTYTFRLEILYQGQSFDDYVTIQVAPEVTIDPVNNNNCAAATFLLNNFTSGSSITSLTSANVTFGSYAVNNGILSINQAIINTPNGIGTITVNGNLNYNGISCPFSQDIYIYECCANASQVDYFFPHNSNMSTQLAAFGTQNINNLNFVIAGNVFIDDNYAFNNCTFYLMPDASLTIQPGMYVIAHNCTMQPCSEYRWDELLISTDAFLLINESNITGAVRGFHVLDGAALNAFDNTFENNYNSIFIENYQNSPFVEIYGNTFVCEEIGHNGIEQAPGSTVPFANPQHDYVTAIALVNSSAVTIGNNTQSANLFTTTNPTNPTLNSELSYINLYNSNGVDIVNNTFGSAFAGIWATSSDFNMGSTNPADKNIFWPATYSPGANPYAGTGVFGKLSSATIEGNEFRDLGTGIFLEKCGLQSEGYGITTITNNPIIEADYAIQFTSPVSTGSRIRINNNPNISASVKGIFIRDFIETDPRHVFINDNNINVSPPVNGIERKGIEIENCQDITIGDNSFLINGIYWPTGASNVIGIHVNKSVGTYISNGGNSVSTFDYGLVMEDDDGTTEFSCTDFDNCYTSILYKNITAPKVQDVNDFYSGFGSATASANVTFTNNINTYPVEVQNCSVGNLARWYYNGAGNNPDPTSLGTYNNAFNPPITSTPLVNGCNQLPAAKNNQQPNHNRLAVSVYPNPNPNGFVTIKLNRYVEAIEITLFDLHGRLIALNKAYGEEVNLQYNISNGMYVMIIEADGERFYEKLVIGQ